MKQACPHCGHHNHIMDTVLPWLLISLAALMAFTALVLSVGPGPAHAGEPSSLIVLDLGSTSWTTGTIGGDNVNIISNDYGPATWTTGNIGDDSVNLLTNDVTDNWSWTTGTIGDDSVNLNKLDLTSDLDSYLDMD